MHGHVLLGSKKVTSGTVDAGEKRTLVEGAKVR